MKRSAVKRGVSVRKKSSGIDVKKVFHDLGITPIEQTPWPIPASPSVWPENPQVIYKTTLSNGTGKAVYFHAELE
jgi:hypothetical protein